MKRVICFIGIVSIGLGVYGFEDNSGLVDGAGVVRPRIDVTHPNASKSAPKLSQLRILWNKTGRMHHRVKIYLVHANQINPSGQLPGVRPLMISSNAPNSGRFLWRIPRSVKPGKYRIKIMTLDDRVSARSAVFKITKIIIKPRCLKVDLVISRITEEWQYPDDVSGWIVVEIQNIRHSTSPFPKGPPFYLSLRGPRGMSWGNKYIVGTNLNTLRNIGKVIIKFHFIDMIAKPEKFIVKVDDTNVVDECIETNNTRVWKK